MYRHRNHYRDSARWTASVATAESNNSLKQPWEIGHKREEIPCAIELGASHAKVEAASNKIMVAAMLYGHRFRNINNLTAFMMFRLLGIKPTPPAGQQCNSYPHGPVKPLNVRQSPPLTLLLTVGFTPPVQAHPTPQIVQVRGLSRRHLQSRALPHRMIQQRTKPTRSA